MTKEELIKRFELFCFGSEGLGKWLSPEINNTVAERLLKLPNEPLTKVQLNQLLVLSGVASISDGFFKYYWTSASRNHPYDIDTLEGYDKTWFRNESTTIQSIEHLRWGLYRIYVDALLYFGNVRAGFTSLRSLNIDELESFFQAKCFDTQAIINRGPAIPLHLIAKDDRYLISEMACKTIGEVPEDQEEAKKWLLEKWEKHQNSGGKPIAWKDF